MQIMMARSATPFLGVIILFLLHATPSLCKPVIFKRDLSASFRTRGAVRSLRGGDDTMSAFAIKTPAACVSMCGKLAPFASVGMCIAPLPTILQVVKEKSVGDLPLLPYSSLVANAFVWTIYGECSYFNIWKEGCTSHDSLSLKVKPTMIMF